MMPTDLKPSAQRVLAYMINNGSITGTDAIMRLHTTELRSRISELKKVGYPISYKWEPHKNEDGTCGRHKRYFLEDGYAGIV